ncbi:MAG: septal ring lytic transglycosylase RlpA family protein [Xanthobacteraceae bacterium]|nr:septal ring lytic transglycosylase RlpA family protein [Xanthobacteraceae bacterium]
MRTREERDGISQCPARWAVFGVICLLLANCSGGSFGSLDPRYGVSSSPRVVGPGEPVPKGGGTYRVGAPYVVAGRTYVPEENPHYRAEGVASWYGSDFHGRLTANGEVFDSDSMSAAHATLPLPSYVRVTNLSNHKSVVVRVNDRGPYSGNRLIDVSQRAASLLGFHGSGLAPVRVEYVGRAPMEGSDDVMLMATLRENGEPAPSPSLVRVASAKGFMPASLASVPASSGPRPRRDVPTPPERPYGLGDGQKVSNFRATSSTTVARAHEAEPVPRPSPVLSAYAPMRSDLAGTGNVPYASAIRGLY